MKSRNIVTLLIALMLVLAACASDSEDAATTTTSAATTTTEADPKADWPETLVYGFIPSERQEKLADTVQPYMDYLSENLGITVEGVITADYTGLVVAMGAGQADLGAFGSTGYVQAETLHPTIEVLLQSIRFGSPTYHGQWFTNDATICDSPPVVGALENGPAGQELVDGDAAIALQVGWGFDDAGNKIQELFEGEEIAQGTACQASLEKVKGKSIAFTSASSGSGGLFPQAQLLDVGIDIENDIEYSYLGSHDNAIAAVYNGDFDIGLSYDDARRTLRKEQLDVGSKVIVFNITEEIPNDVVAVRGELPDNLKQAIFDLTAAYLTTEEGILVFDEIYGWTDIREAIDSEFDIIRDALAAGLG